MHGKVLVSSRLKGYLFILPPTESHDTLFVTVHTLTGNPFSKRVKVVVVAEKGGEWVKI